MSRVMKFGSPNPIPYYDKECEEHVNIMVEGECAYEIDQEESLSEEQIKNMGFMLKSYVLTEYARSIAAAEATDVMELIYIITNDVMVERINKTMCMRGCKVLDIQVTIRMDEESRKKYEQARIRKAEQKMMAMKPKQLTPEELASLPTSSSPLDTIKEKAGKIFKFFSK